MEATAIGNILMQARALGLVNSLDEMRAIVKASFEPFEYEPQFHNGWEEAYPKWQEIIEGYQD
jgi:sugar (pentulose or hexulose) kinase